MRGAEGFKRGREEFDTDVLPTLTDSRFKNALTRLEITANDSVAAAPKASVGAACEQDGAVANQKDVRADGQLEL